IDLAELPERGPLPEGGWLLFFADLDNDDAVDEADNEPGAKARVFALPAGTDPVSGTPPAALREVLRDRPVAFEPQLTLPDPYDAAEHFRLDPAEGEAYDAVALWLRFGDDGWSPDRCDHWVLGGVTGVQGHPTEAGTLLLLHLASDSELGFEFLDGGAIQFRIPADALAANNWRAARALADSC
ncbi:MAG: DUF1963 domain-containing protein, partial [Gemmatimonadetes bacterium]|nr:DUF1963 domain-containing protein [Gemmatimonadota bacterium]